MIRPLGIGLALLFGAGCTQQQPALYASPAEQPAYAERYPGALGALSTDFQASEQAATKATGDFAKYPDQLDKPNWSVVLEVVKAADHAGATGDLAQSMRETDSVRTFYGAEKESIHQKVAGSVEYAAKQKPCEAENLGGTAAGSVDRAIDQTIEDRIHDHNPAIRLIEDNQDAIGKQNVDKLTKQADQITLASYAVRVRMPQAKRDLDALLGDAGTVKSTLEDDQKRANDVLADAKASRAAKTVAEKRRRDASNALAGLDNEVAEAKKLAGEMEQRTKAAQKSYDDALQALLKTLAERADAQAKEAAAKK